MYTTIRLNNPAYFTNFQTESGFFKSRLHLALGEESQIAASFMRGAVGLSLSQLLQRSFATFYSFFISLSNLDSFFFRDGDVVTFP